MNRGPTFIFDFDSTLVAAEALDELAEIALAGEARRDAHLARIREITAMGMDGRMSLEQSLSERLAMLSMRPEMLPPLVERLADRFAPSIWQGRQRLSAMADRVWVVSGGFHEWVEPVIERLGLRTGNVIANRLRLATDGSLELDPAASPCAVDSGKATAIQAAGLGRPRIMVGDGMTDWRVRELGACERFVCFTEVVHRAPVAARADVVAANLDAVLGVAGAAG
ncbi:MAG: D-3-phosphoglycerate dehydrogenase [Planctomycetota bacterium]